MIDNQKRFFFLTAKLPTQQCSILLGLLSVYEYVVLTGFCFPIKAWARDNLMYSDEALLGYVLFHMANAMAKQGFSRQERGK